MSEFTENYPWLTDTRIIGPAQVLEVDKSGSYASLQVKRDFELLEIKARIAIPVSQALYPRDTVLIMGEDPDHVYIIGILERHAQEKPDPKGFIMEGGTYVSQNGQSVQVLSHKRELLFEYDEKSGKACVNLESGDMEFITRNGNINFIAGKDIMLNGRTVGITSRKGIVIGMLNKLGKLLSSVTIKGDGMQLESPEFDIRAEKGKLQINETELCGTKLKADLDSSKISIGRLETISRTIVTKAKNIYKTVEDLSQIKTGRMRTLVENTFHLKSKKSMLKSDDDFKVRAEKIHLG